MLNDHHTIAGYMDMLGIPQNITEGYLREVNPHDDLILTDFAQLRLDLVRTLNARLRMFQKSYWSHLPLEDQVMADAEAEQAFVALKRVEEAEMLYVTEVLLPRDLSNIESILKELPQAVIKAEASARKINAGTQAIYDSGHLVMTEMDRKRHLSAYMSINQLVPPTSPVRGYELERLMKPQDDENPLKIFGRQVNEREAYGLRRWRERLHPIDSLLYAGLGALHTRFWSIAEQNELEGATAQKKQLFTNHNIPRPDQATIMGWYQYANVATRKLTDKEKLHYPQFDWVTTFIPPLLNMTKEHLSQSLVAEQGSQVGWSLTPKSKSHTRNDEGRIRYGIWEAITVLVGPRQQWVTAVDAIEDMLTPSIAFHEEALHLFPRYTSTQHHRLVNTNWGNEFLLDGLSMEEATSLLLYVANPFMAGFEAMRLMDRSARPVITHYAGLGDQFDTYLRFDQHDAFTLWMTEYIEHLRWALYATPDQRLQAIRAWTVDFTQWQRRRGQDVKTKSGQTVRFGNLNLG